MCSFISTEELKQAMQTMGQTLSKAELLDMMKAADANNDGKIDYKEFVAMMKSAE